MTYTDYLKLTSQDIGKMTEGELRAIISDLNDVANKRVKRLKEGGVDISSPAFQALEKSGSTKFKIKRGEKDRRTLIEAYSKVRSFLNLKTSSVNLTKKYVKGMKEALDEILEKAKKDINNLDPSFEIPTLKQDVKDELITNFWKKYNEWAEIARKNNPMGWQTGSPIERVGEFYEDYYEKGKVSLEDFEKGTIKQYEEETKRIQNRQNDDGGTSSPIKRKYKKGRKSSKDEPTQRFEQIKIF